ncbi:hypothetical protein C6499_10125 [Candidatus Poribacteria bacterium]|nr:MAG: hypothetical protein C6499_10125 [Candidatus Poribacteria bacterium]
MKSRIYFMTFAIIMGVFSLNAAPASVVTDGLVSYWPFDNEHFINDTVKDVWGNNNGTLRGNPKVVPGHVGEALAFDGAGDFVNLTTLGDFGKKIGSFTFEAWIKTSNETDWMTLINTHGEECPYWGIELNGVKNKDGLHRGTRRIFFGNSFLNEKNRKKGCETLFVGSGSLNIYEGEWHHIVYIYEHLMEEEKGKEFTYIDTMPKGKGTISLADEWTSFPFTEPVHLGARNFRGKSDGYFEGMIDEVRFYDRPLTADEVIQNFESTEPYNVAPKGKLSTVWGALKAK